MNGQSLFKELNHIGDDLILEALDVRCQKKTLPKRIRPIAAVAALLCICFICIMLNDRTGILATTAFAIYIEDAGDSGEAAQITEESMKLYNGWYVGSHKEGTVRLPYFYVEFRNAATVTVKSHNQYIGAYRKYFTENSWHYDNIENEDNYEISVDVSDGRRVYFDWNPVNLLQYIALNKIDDISLLPYEISHDSITVTVEFRDGTIQQKEILFAFCDDGTVTVSLAK